MRTSVPSADAASEATGRSYWSWLLYAALAGLAWAWVLKPLYLLATLPTLQPTLPEDPMPPKGLLKQVAQYQRIAKSPLFRGVANRRLSLLLSKKITPLRITRSFRALLQNTPLPIWDARFARWDKLLRTLEQRFPALHFEAYRAFLYLQAGQLPKLSRWAHKHKTDAPPQDRLSALRRLWLGHAAFWTGFPQRALYQYQLFRKGLRAHPEWAQRNRRSWRIPAEISTMLYHIGLIERQRKHYTKAYQAFAQLASRWAALRKVPSRSSDVYAARLLAADAAWRAGDRTTAEKYIKAALTFHKDPTVARLLYGRFLLSATTPAKRRQGRALLEYVAQTPRLHHHSFSDSQAIATLLLVHDDLTHQRPRRGLARLSKLLQMLRTRPTPAIFGELTSRNTFPIRFIPMSPAFYGDLLRRLPKLQSMTSPSPATTHPTTTPTSRPQPSISPQVRGAARATHPTTTPTSHPQPTMPSQPTATHPTSRHASTHLKAHTEHFAQIRRDLALLRALAWLKRGDATRAKAALTALAKRTSTAHQSADEADLYLGMLLLEQGARTSAIQHLRRFHRKHPEHAKARIYLVYALKKTQPAQAKALLQPLTQDRFWKRTAARLFPSASRRAKWKKLQQRCGFWWRLLGDKGWLTSRDPQLSRRALVWAQTQAFHASPTPLHIFKALRTSRIRGRFGLLTLLAKAQLLHTLTHNPIYAQQQQYLRKLYQDAGPLEYLLDRALYSHRWGLIALGFF